MQFRKAYFDSVDAQLEELTKQLDEIESIARSFAHLSVVPTLEEEGTEAAPPPGCLATRRARRRGLVYSSHPSEWPTDHAQRPVLARAIAPALVNQ